MKNVLVCGGRDMTELDADIIEQALRAQLRPGDTVLHGGCSGADTIAGRIAAGMGYAVHVYPAQWEVHGRMAGPMRNAEMARLLNKGDLVIAFPGGKGTADMVMRAHKRGVEVMHAARL